MKKGAQPCMHRACMHRRLLPVVAQEPFGWRLGPPSPRSCGRHHRVLRRVACKPPARVQAPRGQTRAARAEQLGLAQWHAILPQELPTGTLGHGLDQIYYVGRDAVVREVQVEREHGVLGRWQRREHGIRQHANRDLAVPLDARGRRKVLEQLRRRRGRVIRKLVLELREQGARLLKGEALARDGHVQHRLLVHHGLEDLDQAPGAQQNVLRRKQHEGIGAVHAVREEGSQIRKRRAVEKDGSTAQHARHDVGQVARVAACLLLVVREEARVLAARRYLRLGQLRRGGLRPGRRH